MFGQTNSCMIGKIVLENAILLKIHKCVCIEKQTKYPYLTTKYPFKTVAKQTYKIKDFVSGWEEYRNQT